jgi:hypothetical protein
MATQQVPHEPTSHLGDAIRRHAAGIDAANLLPDSEGAILKGELDAELHAMVGPPDVPDRPGVKVEADPDAFVARYRPASQDPPWSWQDELGWVAANTFDKFVRLVREVCAEGVREPVEVFDISPLGDPAMGDGHHRVLAAVLTGRPVPYIVLNDVIDIGADESHADPADTDA